MVPKEGRSRSSWQDDLGIKKTSLSLGGNLQNKLHGERLETATETLGSKKEKSKLEQTS